MSLFLQNVPDILSKNVEMPQFKKNIMGTLV
jgi:hypothetical protein